MDGVICILLRLSNKKKCPERESNPEHALKAAHYLGQAFPNNPKWIFTNFKKLVQTLSKDFRNHVTGFASHQIENEPFFLGK